ncbi:MAG: hypothetical protein A2038_09065 [Deltaproteobacteria bacterium GWA2_57_13]|nr:MAG: hypothetical protein A2038_09065 [Deltaproteobacteria bacterium GWA2_57_13]
MPREAHLHLKVLVVDDNDRLAFIIQTLLEAAGYEVRTAQDGRVGYLTYLIFKPELIIADLQMPVQSGLEMMKEIRRHDPQIPAIYMTGDFDTFRSLVEEEKRRYPVRFLEKPFSSREILRLVSDFERRRLQQ